MKHYFEAAVVSEINKAPLDSIVTSVIFILVNACGDNYKT
jgi:hypothetical protein